jgi:predicted DNA-binding transcriptional regulator AlpA
MAQVITQDEVAGFAQQLSLELQNERQQALLQELDLVPPDVFASALGLAEQTLSGWRATGQGPHFVKLGKSIFYRRADIAVWIDKNIHGPCT